jgi:hypothetical protein
MSRYSPGLRFRHFLTILLKGGGLLLRFTPYRRVGLFFQC